MILTPSTRSTIRSSSPDLHGHPRAPGRVRGGAASTRRTFAPGTSAQTYSSSLAIARGHLAIATVEPVLPLIDRLMALTWGLTRPRGSG